MLIDTHAHLDMEQFAPDLGDVLLRAREAGVGHIISVSIDGESFLRNREIAGRHKNISISAGIHPHDAGSFTEESWTVISEGAAEPAVVAVGETGLDFFRDYAPHDKQLELFLRHIELASRVGKPLIVHSRSAEEETLDILQREKASEVGGVMHCYSGSVETARRATDMGFLISIAGPLTYPKSKLPDVVRAIPVESLLVETDAPYLAPQAFRGTRNEPAYVVETARAVAELKGLSEDDVRRITTFNARSLFGLFTGEDAGEIVYPIRDSLYVNVTNRCSNRCVFCGREKKPVVKGHNLRLEGEPTTQEILGAVGDAGSYREIVFCGYGEPLLRWDVVREAAAALKERGARIRVNTNGQSKLILGRDVLPEMEGIVDTLSVSLNASGPGEYLRLCRPDGGENAFAAVKKFISEARRYVPEVIATVVAAPGVDVEACRRIATEELGVGFRARAYNDVG
jgi:TatD DNase family protein